MSVGQDAERRAAEHRKVEREFEETAQLAIEAIGALLAGKAAIQIRWTNPSPSTGEMGFHSIRLVRDP